MRCEYVGENWCGLGKDRARGHIFEFSEMDIGGEVPRVRKPHNYTQRVFVRWMSYFPL